MVNLGTRIIWFMLFANWRISFYLNKELNGEGLIDKLRNYETIDNGTYNLNPEPANDERDYGIGAQILRAKRVTKMKLISNNPKKRVGLTGYGLEIIENIALTTLPPNNTNHLTVI